ncbi:MAG: DUF1446 domain-containing protein [Gammaproteobacteria bacterium]|nr:DUF1446 domain-containing protein [Gammaproteobacteria bacterium]
MNSKTLKILSTATFGFGVGGDAWERGMGWNPDAIVAQGTTSDGGPAYLGSDDPCGALMVIKEDLTTILLSAKKKNIPFILSCGSPAGSNTELERALEIVNEIAQQNEIHLRVAVIPGELEKDYLKGKISSGTPIRRLANNNALLEYLTEEEVSRSKRIVAQMGPEPIMEALGLDVDGVITGRSLDVGLYMALPLKMGFDKALAAHMGKTSECSSLICEPQSYDPVFAILAEDHFLVRPTNEFARCTVNSVVSHNFYERSDPIREENPGGILDTSHAVYEQYDSQTVKVSGSQWLPVSPYTLKIEGVSQVGYRTICVCGVRDPILINCIDGFLGEARKAVEKRMSPLVAGQDYELIFRVYGKDGVLGDVEPVTQTMSHELGIIIEAVSVDEARADSVCQIAVDYMAHMGYPGRVATAANVAFAHSPREHRLGSVYRYNIWHSMELEDPCEPFDIQVREFPKEQ